jgi:hypothetical protein
LVADPAWASSVDTQVGFDGYGQQVLAPLGYLADLRYASGGSVVSSRGDVIVLNSAYHPDLGQWSNLYYGPTVLEWVSAIAEWFTARDNSRARGGYLASINSYQEWQWAQCSNRRTTYLDWIVLPICDLGLWRACNFYCLVTRPAGWQSWGCMVSV